MKIVQFTDCYFPTINGVCSSIKSLVSGLAKMDHKLLVIAPLVPTKLSNYPADSHLNKENSSQENIKFLYLSSMVMPQLKDNRIGFPWPWKIWSEIKKFSPDLIHIHTPGTVGLMGLIYAKLFKVPYMFTHHTLFEEYLTYFPFPSSLSKKLILAWMRLFWNNSFLVVAPSRKVSQRLLEQGCKAPFKVIPSGLHLDSFRNGQRDKLQKELKLSDKPFLYVGRVAYEKSINFIIEAFSVLNAKLKNEDKLTEKGAEALLHLVIIGDGPARADLEKLVDSKDLSLLVHFLGWRKREELKDYYASSLAFVFASETETQGLVVAEAEAAGLPVIAVKASGVDEALPQEKNLSVDSGKIDQFAQHMYELWKDRKKAQEMGVVASQFVEDNFSEKTVLAKYQNIYDSLSLSEKSRFSTENKA